MGVDRKFIKTELANKIDLNINRVDFFNSFYCLDYWKCLETILYYIRF